MVEFKGGLTSGRRGDTMWSRYGEMAEWLKAPVSKTGGCASAPRVRIPISPLFLTSLCNFLFFESLQRLVYLALAKVPKKCQMKRMGGDTSAYSPPFVTVRRAISRRKSGRQDLNLRRPGPKPGALARLSYAPFKLQEELLYHARLSSSTGLVQSQPGTIWPLASGSAGGLAVAGRTTGRAGG